MNRMESKSGFQKGINNRESGEADGMKEIRHLISPMIYAIRSQNRIEMKIR